MEFQLHNYPIANLRPLSGDANSYWRKKLLNFAYRYPLSESVAPPGTAWDAEGLRGNVANENKLMVLVPARSRKGQSRRPFAQEDNYCQASAAEA